jgi:ABC-type polysaccharide/polyol phosphate transport system ATPase subunit
VKPTIRFENVSKRYHLRHNRPRSFRELFVGRRTGPPPLAAEAPSTSLWALRDVSFEIQAGETVALVGSNGAGKSTALKLIGRIMQPTQGRVAINGRVAALLELGAGFHPDLSGRENVYLSGALAGMGRAEIERKYDSIVDFSELPKFMDMPVKHYSSGMFARLAFAVSIHLEPEVLLVDEVLAVGDQNFQQKCLDRIGELRRQGVTICVVTHAMETARRLCSRALWFEHGHLRADGAAEAVVREYLDEALAVDARRLSEGAALLTDEQRWGSREVEIHRVRLTDGAGTPGVIFRTGEPLVINLDYRVREPVAPPVLGIAIHRNDGVHICGPNTGFSNVEVPVHEHHGSIAYNIPALPLLDGLYYVTVSATNAEDTHLYDYHDRAYSFRIVNQHHDIQERYGLMTLNGQWEIGAAQASAAPAQADHAL